MPGGILDGCIGETFEETSKESLKHLLEVFLNYCPKKSHINGLIPEEYLQKFDQ